jgi:hypothetical protein
MSVINEHQSKLDIQNDKKRVSKIDVFKNALCLYTPCTLYALSINNALTC